MKRHLLTTAAFCLISVSVTGCVKGVALGTKAEDALAKFASDGPQVEGVEETLLKSATDMTERGNHRKAVPLYEQLVNIDDTNEEYILMLSDTYRRLGDYDTAEEGYDKLIAMDADNLDAREGKALVKLSTGEFDKAGNMLKEIHQADTTRWRSLNALGILLVERGMLGEAVAYFNEALKQDKNNISVLNNLGLTHAINDDPEKSIMAMKRAIDVAPPKSPLKKNIELNLALVMGVYGDMETAEKLLREHLPDAAVANNLGTYAFLSKNEQLAKSYLNTALSRNPTHYERAWKNLTTITKQSSGVKDTKGRNSKAKVVKVPSS